MVGLVEEIQRDALDPQISVAMLLRKVKLAAVKLQLPAIDEWVSKELQGYTSGPVPPYRQISGTPKAFNPFQGWIPIMGDPKTISAISKINHGQPIAAIEDLIKDNDAAVFQKPLSPEVIHILNKNSDVMLGEMVNFIGRGHLVSILDQVRTMVLDWAIELEKAGIRGESMTFKSEEKIAAQSNPAITIGSVGNFVGVVGNQNHVRDIIGGSISVTQIRDLAQQLRLGHEALVSAGADDAALSSAVDGLLIEADKPDPNPGALKGFLTDARSALAGAAGNLLASGALTVIGTLLGS